MSVLSSTRHFRLRRDGVDCDAEGLRVGRVDLLARGAGRWTPREEGEIMRDLVGIYGLTIEPVAKLFWTSIELSRRV
jgi:hypothetical protein